MIRVLQIMGSLNMGGIENLIVNLYRNIDRDAIQFDFLLYNKPQGRNFCEEVEKLGSKIYYVPSKKESLIRNYKAIKNIVKQNGYKIVWRHTYHSFASIDIIAAKAGGATRRILHSHNEYCLGLTRKLHYLLRPLVIRFATDRLACSEEAGRWLFGNREFVIVNNAIKVDCFAYKEEIRENYRKKFEVENKIVVGNIGRFAPEKNHHFIIDVFYELHKKEDRAVLILIGDGELQDEIKELVRKKGIEDKVLFLNTRSDIAELLQMMDIFIMPSKFEGFGIALLEAQAAGLPCVASDCVPERVNATGKVEFLPLGDVGQWVNMLQAMKTRKRMEDAVDLICEAGYSIYDIAKDIENMILSMENFI